MKLSNCVIVITGGAKGLGRAMAALLVEKGARVVICDRDKIELDKTVDALNSGSVNIDMDDTNEGGVKNTGIKRYAVFGFSADTTSESDMSDLAKKAVSVFGRIDIWINNAGVWLPPENLENIDLKKSENLFQVNVFGTIHGMRAAIKQMKMQGRCLHQEGQQEHNGTIVNIISTTAFDGMNGSSGAMYVSSKYALRGLTNVMRVELAKDNIEVIGVYPGGMKTDIFNVAKPQNIDQFMSAKDVAHKIIENFEQANPQSELILKRPGQVVAQSEKHVL